jgi:hypothetical protein
MNKRRRSLIVCIKGKLDGDVVTDEKLNNKINELDTELLTLDTVMSNQQLSKQEDKEYISFMQNIMQHTLALTVNQQLAVQVFIQLGVATGELDINLQDESVTYEYNWRWDKKFQVKDYKGMEIESIKIGDWIEYLISFQGSMSWAFEAKIGNEEQERIRREVKKNGNQLEDRGRNRNKIIDIKQENLNGLYVITTADVITGEKSVNIITVQDDVLGVDLNNNKYYQGRDNATQEDLLLLRPILNKTDWNDLNNDDYDETTEIGNDSTYEPFRREDEMIIEKNVGIQVNKDGMKGRLNAMIADSFEEEHWDRTEMMGVCSGKNEAKRFAASIIEDLNINEDLKFNLQQKVYEKELQFQLIINNNKKKLTGKLGISIQKLIYLCERKKRSNEVGNKS